MIKNSCDHCHAIPRKMVLTCKKAKVKRILCSVTKPQFPSVNDPLSVTCQRRGAGIEE